MSIATIHKPWYDRDGRKYIDLQVGSDIFKIKIPFRYGRVVCTVEGIRPIQDLKLGEPVSFEFESKIWNGQEYMILKSISPLLQI